MVAEGTAGAMLFNAGGREFELASLANLLFVVTGDGKLHLAPWGRDASG